MSRSSFTADDLPVPRPVTETIRTAPVGNALSRGIRALLQGRLPESVRAKLDAALTRVGFRHRRVRVRDLNIIRRRTSWDEGVVHCVLIQEDYTPAGFNIEHADTVIDIGGNIGCFAVLAAKRASAGRVLVFEPDGENYRLLCRNIEGNELSNVVAERVAVVGKAGTRTLFKAPHGPLHTTIPQRLAESVGAESVKAITLADIFDRFGVRTCDFLKLDCEGAEYDILYNTPPDYLKRIRKIVLEYHAQSEKQTTAGKLAAYLESHGFEIVDFTDFVGFDAGFLKARRNEHSKE